jgi:hypothetical protein
VSDITVQIDNAEMHARLQQLGSALTNLQPAMRSIGQSFAVKVVACLVTYSYQEKSFHWIYAAKIY